ncbi:hypothetical protein C4K88_14315 [Arthrobacter pityocampae]|uniref:Uncharacterized protein n=1 Tax=Arthrobacter pityocampae TaxID=547334 RepID=A0A2S5IUB5_9MICC|nr:sigma-70 family RNA polymerase sigma factor [Arthrobacter pityocampae]PPB48153.1 hypothetical protein C4K88_14315 [Arthrobacter pityocampae]
MLDDYDARAALHDAAYRYAFRRSLSVRLATSAAREAIDYLHAAPAAGLHDPGDPADPAEGATSAAESDRVAVLRAARSVLQRYLPTTLPPRAVGDPALQTALADLAPADRELLLLHHWDGLPVEDAARLAGGNPGRLPAVEAACAQEVRQRGASAGDAAADHAPAGDTTTGGAAVSDAAAGDAVLSTTLAALLSAADPAAAISVEDLVRSRQALPGTATGPGAGVRPETRAVTTPSIVPSTTGQQRVTTAAAGSAPLAAAGEGQVAPSSPGTAPGSATPMPAPDAPDDVPAATRDFPRFLTRPGAPGRRAQVALGTFCLLAVVAGLTAVLFPRAAPGPAGEAERLFALADVVAVVSIADLTPTQVDGELRMLQAAAVVQIVKGDAEESTLTIDVTGRSTLERPFSRDLFTPDRLMFLVRDDDGVLSPIEGDASVLTLIDRRSPETTTIAGDPAPLPDALRNAIDALPLDELALDTNGTAPGLVAEDAVLGIRPPEDDDVQNRPRNPLGSFRVLPTADDRACAVFEYDGRSVLLRWPEGFSAYERTEVLAYPNGDPRRGRQVLTVLNDRGYPYVDHQRQVPFIGGTPTGRRDECGGEELEVWDIAVEPGTTLLTY